MPESDLQLYLKRDSGAGVSLGILRNFSEHLFYWWMLLSTERLIF